MGTPSRKPGGVSVAQAVRMDAFLKPGHRLEPLEHAPDVPGRHGAARQGAEQRAAPDPVLTAPVGPPDDGIHGARIEAELVQPQHEPDESRLRKAGVRDSAEQARAYLAHVGAAVVLTRNRPATRHLGAQSGRRPFNPSQR
jgi:hypothetical protein